MIRKNGKFTENDFIHVADLVSVAYRTVIEAHVCLDNTMLTKDDNVIRYLRTIEDKLNDVKNEMDEYAVRLYGDRGKKYFYSSGHERYSRIIDAVSAMVKDRTDPCSEMNCEEDNERN